MRYCVNRVGGGLLVLCVSLSQTAGAQSRAPQSGPVKTGEQLQAAFEAHKTEFDYMLGDWEFTADSRQYGKVHGYWSAVRLPEGQIVDEFRVVDERGETTFVTTTLRAYNAALDRWDLVGMDAGGGLQDTGSAQRVGSEMHLEQRRGVDGPNPSLRRIRYFNIGPDRFSWLTDISTDGGKTWEKNYQRIEARRIGPARTMGPIADPKRVAPSPKP